MANKLLPTAGLHDTATSKKHDGQFAGSSNLDVGLNNGLDQTLAASSEMARLVQNYDWASTPLGPIDRWPQHLTTAVNIVLHSAFPMFVWWGKGDLIAIYNDAYAKILGDLHPAALGKSARQFRSDVWQNIGPLVDDVFRTGQPIYRKDLRLEIQHEGSPSERYFTFSYSPISNDAGAVDGLFCATTETTEEVLDKQKLTSLNQAKDEFISLASHQLRTPATGVKQYLGMLLGDFAGELTASQREFVQHAYDSNERQLSTVSDLLSIAQADAGKINLHCHPIDLVHLIDGVLDEQATKFTDRRQGISFKHQAESCIVSIDEVRMRMVLENLVDNASKYTPEGKNISLALSHPTSSAAEAAGDSVTITITDQGVGIAKKDLSTIFDKFIRVDNPLSEAVGGNGLGLYLAQKIVELHGGVINVTSTPGKGSTFAITLPTGSTDTLQ